MQVNAPGGRIIYPKSWSPRMRVMIWIWEYFAQLALGLAFALLAGMVMLTLALLRWRGL